MRGPLFSSRRRDLNRSHCRGPIGTVHVEVACTSELARTVRIAYDVYPIAPVLYLTKKSHRSRQSRRDVRLIGTRSSSKSPEFSSSVLATSLERKCRTCRSVSLPAAYRSPLATMPYRLFRRSFGKLLFNLPYAPHRGLSSPLDACSRSLLAALPTYIRALFIRIYNHQLISIFMMKCLQIGLILMLLGAAGVQCLYPSNSDVVDLTLSNFDNKVLNDDSVWIVEFYAPWCGHCQKLKPDYEKAASALKVYISTTCLRKMASTLYYIILLTFIYPTLYSIFHKLSMEIGYILLWNITYSAIHTTRIVNTYNKDILVSFLSHKA
jgi:thiol-disulfide isomerase/thioredoxin